MAASVLDPLTAPSRPEAAPPTAVTKAAKPRRALIVLPVLVALAVATAGGVHAYGLNKESTDDAQVEGHVANVSARVGGQVHQVLVRDNQHVKAGDVLVELDDREFRVKVDSAKADVAAAAAQLRAAETALAVTEKTSASALSVARGGLTQAVAVRANTHAAIDQASAEINASTSRRALAETELARTESLFANGAVSRAEYDARKAAFDQAVAESTRAEARLVAARTGLGDSSGTLESARGRLMAAETAPEQIEAARAQVSLAKARLDQVKAALEQAELNLSFTKVRAETSGVVARRSVEVGQMASPERAMMAIVPLDDTWVVANFKEDQIAEMHPNQRVRISVDSYADHDFEGKVDSLAGGTGARFALLPPDNASGNFTKVVQRVPVLIRLDPHPGIELRPGLSATATVYTK